MRDEINESWDKDMMFFEWNKIWKHINMFDNEELWEFIRIK